MPNTARAGGDARDDQTGRFVRQPNGRVRPLSPHLQVWRWHVTMLASILTRMTGVGLYAGAVLVALWLAALAFGPEAYTQFLRLGASPLGLLIWIGLTLSLLYHLAAGVRHLIWDVGCLLSPKDATTLSWFSIGFGLIGTIAFWIWLFASGKVQL